MTGPIRIVRRMPGREDRAQSTMGLALVRRGEAQSFPIQNLISVLFGGFPLGELSRS